MHRDVHAYSQSFRQADIASHTYHPIHRVAWTHTHSGRHPPIHPSIHPTTHTGATYMQREMHTFMQVYIHTYIPPAGGLACIYIHTYANACIHILTETGIQTYTHTSYIHPYIQSDKHT